VSIATGPDGALWFTNYGGDPIGRITTAGKVSTFTDRSIHNPVGITTGPDRALWFTNDLPSAPSGGHHGRGGERYHRPMGRITTAGMASVYRNRRVGVPEYITAGNDGGVWFTDGDTSAIGRISTAPSIAVSPTSGPPGTSVTVTGGGVEAGATVTVVYRTGAALPALKTVVPCTATVADRSRCASRRDHPDRRRRRHGGHTHDRRGGERHRHLEDPGGQDEVPAQLRRDGVQRTRGAELRPGARSGGGRPGVL